MVIAFRVGVHSVPTLPRRCADKQEFAFRLFLFWESKKKHSHRASPELTRRGSIGYRLASVMERQNASSVLLPAHANSVYSCFGIWSVSACQSAWSTRVCAFPSVPAFPPC
nr:MAG TPA: hypothetical protein [Caudoviricetes sp.]